MKTNELTGNTLDWAVHYALHGQCEGYAEHEYSTDWAQGGPIIERERVNVDPSPDSAEWYSYYDNNGKWHSGPTPLIAAMRCYVSSKFGDTVPEELA
jgi:hypothetical protein